MRDQWNTVGCKTCGAYFTVAELYQCDGRCRACAGLPEPTEPRCPGCGGGPLEKAPEYPGNILACKTCDGLFRGPG